MANRKRLDPELAAFALAGIDAAIADLQVKRRQIVESLKSGAPRA